MPKRVTGYSGTVQSCDKPLCTAAPGHQDATTRVSVYTQEARPNDSTYVQADLLTHSQSIAAAEQGVVKHTDYHPPKDYTPQGAKYNRNSATTKHWQSTYQAQHCADKGPTKSFYHYRTPLYQCEEPQKCLNSNTPGSTYQATHCNDSRNPIADSATTWPKKQDPLGKGTPSGTHYIPGTSLALPFETFNSRKARFEQGENPKQPNNKDVLDLFHTNMPGYTGTRPRNILNNRGSMQLIGRETRTSAEIGSFYFANRR